MQYPYRKVPRVVARRTFPKKKFPKKKGDGAQKDYNATGRHAPRPPPAPPYPPPGAHASSLCTFCGFCTRFCTFTRRPVPPCVRVTLSWCHVFPSVPIPAYARREGAISSSHPLCCACVCRRSRRASVSIGGVIGGVVGRDCKTATFISPPIHSQVSCLSHEWLLCKG